jgi:hypothetical protein
MVHFDLPWSLMVLQQRNGRIDRYGQEQAPHIVYLMTEAEHPRIKGDLRILELLADKSEQAQLNIGDPSAFMNVFDVEQEEQQTAEAIEQGLSAEQFGEELEGRLLDPFAVLFGEGAETGTSGAVRKEPLSLYESDFEYLQQAIDRLRETDGVKAEVRAKEQLVELTWTEDLRRRYRKLPAEVRPKDGVIVLTADPERMRRAIDDARRQEDSWPTHQYLWANNPVLQWASDRLRRGFGRHTAPVLLVPAVGGKDDAVVVVSGLLANRRGQPLVHRWYAASFTGKKLAGVEPFEGLVERVELGRKTLPNAKEDVGVEALAGLLGPAIDAVGKQLDKERRRFEKRTRPKLDAELERLAQLERRRMAFIDEQFAKRTGKRAEEEKEQRRRQAKGLFERYRAWADQAMTPSEEPFFEVVAVLVGGAR